MARQRPTVVAITVCTFVSLRLRASCETDDLKQLWRKKKEVTLCDVTKGTARLVPSPETAVCLQQIYWSKLKIFLTDTANRVLNFFGNYHELNVICIEVQEKMLIYNIYIYIKAGKYGTGSPHKVRR